MNEPRRVTTTKTLKVRPTHYLIELSIKLNFALGNWIITISITEHLLVTRETQLEGRDNEMNLGTWRGFKT